MAANEGLATKALEMINAANNTGKVRKGVNETTKAIERGVAKFVVYAEDVDPKEVVMHLPILCKEKQIPCMAVPSKENLGKAVGIPVATSAVAILVPGDGADMLKSLSSAAKE